MLMNALGGPAARVWGHHRAELLIARQSAGRLTPAPVKAVRARLAPLKRRLTSDAFSQAVGDIVETEPITSAMLIGEDRWSRVARAVEGALGRNPNVLSIQTFATPVPAQRSETSESAEPDRGDERLIFVSASGWPLVPDLDLLRHAQAVVVEGTVEPPGLKALEALLERGDFAVVLHDPLHAGGRALLRRSGRQEAGERVGGDAWSE